MYTGTGEFQYVAACTVQVLELFETFDEELKWIWRRPWSWLKCVFLFTRYGSLTTQALIISQHMHASAHPYTHTQCFKWAVLRTFSPFVYAACVHIILIARGKRVERFRDVTYPYAAALKSTRSTTGVGGCCSSWFCCISPQTSASLRFSRACFGTRWSTTLAAKYDEWPTR